MKEFFKVTDLEQTLKYASCFPLVETEEVALLDLVGRVMADDIISGIDLPGFTRSTMDGYAVCASSTFGATEQNPAYLTVKGSVAMGETPSFAVEPGTCGVISTGGMLPDGADSVIMIEYTGPIDDTIIEVYRSVAPGRHVVLPDEDIKKGDILICRGQKIRPQDAGLLAAFGKESVKVYKKPVIGVISTGDEVVPVNTAPAPGQIRDINTYTLSGLIKEAGGIPLVLGIVQDDFDALFEKCSSAFDKVDMILISGGSSVGMRDYTVDVFSAMPDSEIIIHGISISPGKPTILANVQKKPFWGIPGHVVSAMIVFAAVIRPFIDHIGGISLQYSDKLKASALLTRNISSVLGRVDYIRVRLIEKDGILQAEPILGKSGLINTMVKADGLVEIGINTEGLYKGARISVICF